MNKSELRAIILEELEKSKASLLTEKFASSIIGDINNRLDNSTSKDLWNSTANTYGIAWDKVKDEHVSTGANPRRNQLNIFFVAEGTRNPYAGSQYRSSFYRDALLGISVGKKVIGFSGNHFYRDPGATKKSKKVNTNADNYSKVGVGVDAKVWNYKRMLEVSSEVFSIDIDAIQNWNRELQTLRAEQQDGATAMQQNDEILKDNKNRYKQAIKVIKDAGVSGKEFEIVMEHLADAEQILTKELKQKIKDTRRGIVYPGWDNPFQLAVNLHSDMVKKFEDFQRYAIDAKKEGGKWYAKYLTQIAHDVKKIKVDFDRRIIKATSQKEQSITESVLPVNEGSRKKVTKSMWQKMSDDEKENALLTVFEDPDTAQKWIERKWNSLPGSVARDMYTESVLPVNEAASLVDEVTGKAVKLPYKTKDFRGDAITVKGFTEPHKSSSSGRIQTDQGEFFPGVAGVKIVGHKFEGVTEAKSNIAKKWDSTNTMMDDLREFITDAKDAGGEELVMDIADALKLMTNYAMGMTKESKDLTWNSLKESLGLNEGRSINKISKEHSQVVVDMKQTVDSWKEAEGDRKSELLEMLRELNKRKSELEKELDDAVAGKDRNVQLALEEAKSLAYLEIDIKTIFKDEQES